MTTTTPTPVAPQQRAPGWTAGRVLGLTAGIGLLLGSAGLLTSAAALHSADADRDDGYLTSQRVTLHSDDPVLTSTDLDLEDLPGSWLVGDTRLQVTPLAGDVFVGVASASDVADTFGAVTRSTVTDIDDDTAAYEHHDGAAPGQTPGALAIWAAQDSGPGTLAVTWPEDGSWTAVVMDDDASGGVDVEVAVQAEAPHLDELAVIAATGGALALVGGTLALLLVVRRVRAAAGS